MLAAWQGIDLGKLAFRRITMKHAFLLLALLSAAPAAANAMSFAQLALGGGYEATIFVTNKTSFRWTGELRPYQGMNQRWGGTWSINGQPLTGASAWQFALEARQTIKLTLAGDAVTRSGYLDIEGTGSSYDSSVAVAYFYGYYAPTGKLLDTVGSPESEFGKRFFFPAEVTSTIDTGMAWCPVYRFSNTTFPIIISAYNENGQQVAQKTVTFSGHEAQFVSQVFPSLPKPFRGQIYLEALEYFTLEVLRLEETVGGFQLTSTPPDSYVP
jgi:hypothetical protein